MKNAQDKYWENVRKGNKTMLNARVRSAIYAITAVVAPVVAYLGTEGVLSKFWVGLFSVVVSAVTALAFSKVTPDQE